MSGLLLSIDGLGVEFDTVDGRVRAVDGVGFDIAAGETLGLVGESGCGKSVTALSVMGLIDSPPGRISAGRITFEGRDLLGLKSEEMRAIRGHRIAMIFQEPMTSLNPVMTIGRQIAEPLMVHLEMNHQQAWDRAAELLDLVRIPAPRSRLGEYPHQFSGGMRQRVMIAMALACNPKLLIADEPTTALDVTIQAQILSLMQKLKDDLGAAVLLITHDLGVVAQMARRVVVMYAGQVVEEAGKVELFEEPLHPYTKGLLRSMPRLGGGGADGTSRRLAEIPGVVPVLTRLPPGCRFAGRCPSVFELCRNEAPALTAAGPGRRVRCWLTNPRERDRSRD